jgi:hypothetical protein
MPTSYTIAGRGRARVSATTFVVSPKRCVELLNTVDNQVIKAFQDRTMCETLVHVIGWVKAKTTRKLLDLTTDYANGGEAVTLSKRK